MHDPSQMQFAAYPVRRNGTTMRIGVGGPVGSGKTALVTELCRRLAGRFPICVVTNDIYTREDAEALLRAEVLEAERIVGVETGGCPHTAIRDDISMNARAIEDLEDRFPDTKLVLVESGGDNLAANFSPELVDCAIYVIDVAGGDDVPRKGGPGLTRSELLVINKVDLAPLVGSDVPMMVRDADALRAGAPTLAVSVMHGDGFDDVVDWVIGVAERGEWTAATSTAREDHHHRAPDDGPAPAAHRAARSADHAHDHGHGHSHDHA
ncbi:urease accessory protein UreG [Patulibacter minatonensis]|uniref:urease accessory protein UreG n=1 Tax=Patulibacter minatonensis TaxID=298163 RepID=UPI0004B5F8AD|nr:urease accessory protein UreG [Patulibacter minatonensis]